MYQRIICVVAFCSVVLLLAGCNGAQESEEQAYIIALGLDKSGENQIQITYQLSVPKPEGGKSEEGKNAVIISNTAVNLAESLNLLNSMIALSPKLSHVKVIVIGEELARAGVTTIVAPFMRYREFRGSMFVLVARGSAKLFLENNQPIFNISPSKYFELMLGSFVDSGYYLRTSFHQFYQRLKSPSGQAYVTLVSVNPRSGQGKISSEKVAGEKNNGYQAGDIPRQGGNAVDFAGTAIFSGDKMVGTLSTTETRILAMLLGEEYRGFLAVEDPLDAKYFVNMNLHLGEKPKIKVVLQDGKPVITIHILLEGDFSNIPSGIHYEEQSYLKLLEVQVNKIYEQQMRNVITHTQILQADVVGFGYYLQTAFQTNQEYEDYQWNKKYPTAEVNIEIATKIRRTGLMLKTLPTK